MKRTLETQTNACESLRVVAAALLWRSRAGPPATVVLRLKVGCQQQPVKPSTIINNQWNSYCSIGFDLRTITGSCMERCGDGRTSHECLRRRSRQRKRRRSRRRRRRGRNFRQDATHRFTSDEKRGYRKLPFTFFAVNLLSNVKCQGEVALRSFE